MTEGNVSKTYKVLLFYPNLIGYLRIIFMTIAFYTAFSNWKATLFFYSMAFAGDAIDGYVARAFHQASVFGGILDMVTDRVSTCGFLTLLSHLYPEYAFTIIMLIVLDIASHWFHVMSVEGHHKAKESLQNRNVFLQWYYSIYPLFGYCCVGTEFFYILLYVLHFYSHPIIIQLCFYGCLPACILKQVVNVFQLWSAVYTIASNDATTMLIKKE